MARQKRSEEQEKPQAQPPHPMLFGQTLSELDDEEIEEMAQEDEFDIFVDVGDKLTKAGDRITYTIKRDGDFIAGAIRHPFSWDKIKKDWKAAEDFINKWYIKLWYAPWRFFVKKSFSFYRGCLKKLPSNYKLERLLTPW